MDTARARLEAAAKAVGRWVRRDKLQQSTQAAGAIQSPLRPTQYFDTGQITGIEIWNECISTAGTPERYIVNHDSHGGRGSRRPGRNRTCRYAPNCQRQSG